MNYMVKQMRGAEDMWIRSKVRFQWDFHKELEKLVEISEDIITKQIIPNYWVEYTEYGDCSIKVKIKCEKLTSEKLIICNFDYSKNDEKFWYVTPKFKVSEKSQKTKNYELQKFPIIQSDKIIKVFIKKLIDIIEEF
jgi:hypothetical protein